ncbi:major facilitator superfamily domain-containing protein [Aspergillus falconensis]
MAIDQGRVQKSAFDSFVDVEGLVRSNKTTLSYAAVFGLEDDLHFKGSEYSWLGAIFCLGYLVWEFPTNVMLRKLPRKCFMAGTVIIWGGILMCHGASTNFSGQAAARTFLGAFEASINPGTMLLFSVYFGIGHIHSAVASWRDGERELVVARVKDNSTGAENRGFKKGQFWEAMMDVKAWLLFLFAFTSNSPNGRLTSFQGLIIKGMGFSTLQTTHIQMPPGGVQLIVCPLAWKTYDDRFFVTHYTNSHLLIMLLCIVPFLAGVLGLWLLPSSNLHGRLVCLWISFAYTTAWSLSMSVATANTADTKKSPPTKPRYPLGVGMMFSCIVVQAIYLVGLCVLLWWRNSTRGAS